MTDPIPAPLDERAWLAEIAPLLQRCRHDSDPHATDNPDWILDAAVALARLVHERTSAAVAAQRTLTDAARNECTQLVRAFMSTLADIVRTGAVLDRDTANDYLRQFGLPVLEGRYTVSLAITLTATVTADDETDAAGQARELLHNLGTDVEVGEVHTDEIVEQEIPDPF